MLLLGAAFYIISLVLPAARDTPVEFGRGLLYGWEAIVLTAALAVVSLGSPFYQLVCGLLLVANLTMLVITVGYWVLDIERFRSWLFGALMLAILPVYGASESLLMSGKIREGCLFWAAGISCAMLGLLPRTYRIGGEYPRVATPPN
jgi:hypothetical protein